MVDRSARPGRCVAIVQARMGSSRLRGKTLAEIEGKPLLEHVVDRALASAWVDEVMLATTVDHDDDSIEQFCTDNKLRCFRGSVDDVLDRYYQAATIARAEHIVRVTADDPFKDPEIIDLVAAAYFEDPSADYVSNAIDPTFPDGLDVEVVSRAALAIAWKEARLASEREHVTPFIWKRRERFRIISVKYSRDLSDHRWTLDYPEDLAFTRAVYHHLYHGQVFHMRDVLALLDEHPEIAKINAGHVKNEGYTQSLEEDSRGNG